MARELSAKDKAFAAEKLKLQKQIRREQEEKSQLQDVIHANVVMIRQLEDEVKLLEGLLEKVCEMPIEDIRAMDERNKKLSETILPLLKSAGGFGAY